MQSLSLEAVSSEDPGRVRTTDRRGFGRPGARGTDRRKPQVGPGPMDSRVPVASQVASVSPSREWRRGAQHQRLLLFTPNVLHKEETVKAFEQSYLHEEKGEKIKD